MGDSITTARLQTDKQLKYKKSPQVIKEKINSFLMPRDTHPFGIITTIVEPFLQGTSFHFLLNLVPQIAF